MASLDRAGMAPVGVRPSAAAARSRTKRALDVVVALAAGIVLLPLLLAVAIAVRIDSEGPVLFGQDRVGLNGTTFRMWKFRSMRCGASDGVYQEVTRRWLSGDMPPGGYKPRLDPRVTRVGRWLRRTSVDELPQLLNVLRGEMSVVGPRPMPWDVVSRLEAAERDRHLVRPGITGPWQVAPRYHLSVREMVDLDLRYVREWSLGLDLAILARTPVAALRGRTYGA